MYRLEHNYISGLLPKTNALLDLRVFNITLDRFYNYNLNLYGKESRANHKTLINDSGELKLFAISFT